MYATVEQYLGSEEIPDSKLRQISRQHQEKFDSKPEPIPNNQPSPSIHMTWKTEYINNTADPKVWGPAYWFTKHVGAAHYPLRASPIVKERMKGSILAVPYEISCNNCRSHASAFIEYNRDNLDRICSGRHELGKFWVDFHNKVNERYGKPQWTYEQAYKMYSGGAEIRYLQ